MTTGNEPEHDVQTPPPRPGDVRIVPRKTAFGSYVIIRRLAAGGMGEVWEGWLIPSAELGTQLLRGDHRELRLEERSISRIGGMPAASRRVNRV